MRRVYVGRLSYHVRERDVQRFFRSEGKIREILMKDGFAFVEFDHPEDAEAAVRHLNGRDINGDRVHVEFAKGPPRGRTDGNNGGRLGGRGLTTRNGPTGRNFRTDRGRDRGDNHSGRGISYAEKYGPPRNTDYRVIVENLSSRVSWQDLKDHMRQAGEVTFADAHKRERNLGIVDFASLKDMKRAVETLNDTEFHGRRIRVYEDKSRRHRSSGGNNIGGGGGREGGGSSSGRRSRSRSRSHDHAAMSNSRSRSGSPVARGRNDRSRSGSPVARGRNDRSRSGSPVASSRDDRSRSKSPIARVRDDRSRSHDESTSSSPVRRKPIQRSRSRSRTRSSSSSRSSARSSSRDSPQPIITLASGAGL